LSWGRDGSDSPELSTDGGLLCKVYNSPKVQRFWKSLVLLTKTRLNLCIAICKSTAAPQNPRAILQFFPKPLRHRRDFRERRIACGSRMTMAAILLSSAQSAVRRVHYRTLQRVEVENRFISCSGGSVGQSLRLALNGLDTCAASLRNFRHRTVTCSRYTFGCFVFL
jgi:hypothetical protein